MGAAQSFTSSVDQFLDGPVVLDGMDTFARWDMESVATCLEEVLKLKNNVESCISCTSYLMTKREFVDVFMNVNVIRDGIFLNLPMELFDDFARGGDGRTIFLPDILTPLALFCDADIGEKVDFIFELFDMNKSGSISIDELVLLMESSTKGLATLNVINRMPTDDEIVELNQRYFERVDTDSSGTIEKEEFRNWFLQDLNINLLLTEFDGKKPQQVNEVRSSKVIKCAAVEATILEKGSHIGAHHHHHHANKRSAPHGRGSRAITSGASAMRGASALLKGRGRGGRVHAPGTVQRKHNPSVQQLAATFKKVTFVNKRRKLEVARSVTSHMMMLSMQEHFLLDIPKVKELLHLCESHLENKGGAQWGSGSAAAAAGGDKGETEETEEMPVISSSSGGSSSSSSSGEGSGGSGGGGGSSSGGVGGSRSTTRAERRLSITFGELEQMHLTLDEFIQVMGDGLIHSCTIPSYTHAPYTIHSYTIHSYTIHSYTMHSYTIHS
jgi:Ca2+-binding EF-hand superfamily protein